MSKSSPSLNFSIPYHPWIYFFIFLASNILLSYFSLSLQYNLWIGLFGILLPLGFSLFQPDENKNGSTLSQKEFLPSIPTWIWILLGAAALYVRFYKLTTLSVWPNYDDGLWGFLAIDFYHTWDWSLFYQDNSYPSAYLWGLGLLFKLFQPSLFLLWFYPACLSTLVVPLGFLAARRYFSKSFSFVFTLLLALSFWPMFVGRFGNQQILTLLFECLWLWLLARLVKRPWSSRLWREPVLVGLVTALGFYIYISWVAVAFFSCLTVLAVWWRSPSRNLRPVFVFLTAFFFSLTPLLEAGLLKNYMRIIRDIGSIYNPVPFTSRMDTAVAYLSSIFWGASKDHYSYQPVWGGLLNPLLGALFLLGIGAVFKAWRKPFSQWLLLGLFLFFAPGVLTHDVEPFRMLPIIPFLLVVCVIGLYRLLWNFSFNKNVMLIFIFAVSFAGLDFYHLGVRYHHLWDLESVWKGYAKPMEFYRAYGILDKTQKEKGPGLIYSEFKPGLCDQTLMVADHSFNAAQNPDLSFASAQWAAVLVNVNYQPFLKRRFPKGKAFFLSAGLTVSDGGEMLWVMPVTGQNRKTLSDWQEASRSFCCFPGRYTLILRKNLEKAYPLYHQDPFLESCFWEKMTDLDFKISYFKDAQKPIEDLEKGLKMSYGAAQLYYRLAVFHLMRSEIPQAKEALRKAITAPLDMTQSRQLLQSLSSLGIPKAAAP